MPNAFHEQWSTAPDRRAMCDLLTRHREMLVRRVVSELLAHAATYEQLDLYQLHSRVLRLIDLLAASLQDESAVFTQNVERLVGSWLVAGPSLEEILRALGVLQLEVWSLVAARRLGSQEERWAASDLTSCIGAARDQLALVLLARTQRQGADTGTARRPRWRGAAAGSGPDLGLPTELHVKRKD